MLQRLAVERGAMLFDPGRVTDPGWQLFDCEYWRARSVLQEQRGGRGSIHFIEDGARSWALRRYLRGGLPARLVRERFLYLGEERTRPFRELRLLARLRELKLPVPAPVAAGYQRDAFSYVAGILTERLPQTHSLAEFLQAGALDDTHWAAIGRTLRRFHDAGVHHADLAAGNILLDDRDAVWLIDFDRGRMRRPGTWRTAVLARLGRSLAKLAGDRSDWRSGFAILRAMHDAPPG
ncbi:MAG: 3-deoxy-D-manno-octulosonic acid kinase [Gammaproteobacteria bacterium]|nr:MAG: 3-deoxy-D-manno-octulosonic acid kinase [Gammaproteobacteria bacterium]